MGTVKQPGVQWRFGITAQARAEWEPWTRDKFRDIKRAYLETGRGPVGIWVRLISSGRVLTHPEACKRMESWRGNCRPGIVEHYATDRMTLHDYDNPIKPPAIAEILYIAGILGAEVRTLEFFPSRRGTHLAITWSVQWTPTQTVAVQALLGSDPRREAHNLRRLMDGWNTTNDRGWNILFRSKVH
jgi:hypothetical protein